MANDTPKKKFNDPTRRLVYASIHGDLNKVMEAVKEGGNPQEGLEWAACEGHAETFKYLMTQGADIHAGKEGPLINSAYCGHLKIVKILVANGAVISAEKNEALVQSLRRKHKRVAAFLIKQGADIQAGLEAIDDPAMMQWLLALRAKNEKKVLSSTVRVQSKSRIRQRI